MKTSNVPLTFEQKILTAAVDSHFALTRAHQHCIAVWECQVVLASILRADHLWWAVGNEIY